MATPHCAGTITTGGAGEALCSVAWSSPASSWAAVDPADAASYFGAGFVFVVVAWATGKAVSVVLKAIRSW